MPAPSPVQKGTRWGSLVVLRLIRKNESGQKLWEVKCDCGVKTHAWGYNLVKGKKTTCAGTGRHIERASGCCGQGPYKD